MAVEFATHIKDYDFSDIPEKTLEILKEKMTNTLLFEKVHVCKVVRFKSKSVKPLENQTHWNLI